MAAMLCGDIHGSALAPWRLATLAPTPIPGVSFLGQPPFAAVLGLSFALYAVVWCLCRRVIHAGAIARWRLTLLSPPELCSSVAAALNTILVTPAAYYCIFASGGSGLDWWRFHLALTLGYFLFDLLTFTLPYKAHTFTAHHLLVLIGHFPAAVFQGECLSYVWVSAACFIVETSNLFLFARILLGCSTSPRARVPFAITSAGLLVTFVPCRVLWLPVVFKEMYVLVGFPVFYYRLALFGIFAVWIGGVFWLAGVLMREGKMFFTHMPSLASLRKDM